MKVRITYVNFLLVIFTFYWICLFNLLLRLFGFERFTIYANYIYLITVSVYIVFLLFSGSTVFNYFSQRKVYKGVVHIVLLYLFYALFQIVLTPDSSDITSYIDNYSGVLPSFGIALLLAVCSNQAKVNTAKVLRIIVYLMLTVIVSSELFADKGNAGTDEEFRAGGIFGQANNYGYFLALFGIFITVDIVGIMKLFRKKIVSYMAIFLTLFLILKTGSYGSLIVLLVAITWLYIKSHDYITLKKIVGTVLSLIFIVLSLLFLTTQINTSRVSALRASFDGKGQEQVAEASTFDVRYILLVKGLESFYKNPIMGKGLNGRYILLPGEHRARPVHNVYVVELMKGGLIGLAIFLLIYYRIWNAVKRINNPKQRILSYVLLFYLLFIDNTLTYAAYFSVNSGIISLGIIFTIVFQDLEEVRSN